MIINKLLAYPRSVTADGPAEEDLESLVLSLWSDLKALKARYRVDGKDDLTKLSQTPEFISFRIKACRLRNVRVAPLLRYDTPPSDAVYWVTSLINLFNLIVWQGFIQVGVPSASMGRASFYSKVGVDLGGHEVTLNQILNGEDRVFASSSYPPRQ